MLVFASEELRAVWLSEVSSDLNSVADARHEVLDHLRAVGVNRRLDVVAVVVSELVSNAIRHGAQPIAALVFASPTGVQVRVEDASDAIPQIREPCPGRVGGHGMYLIANLASDWGITSASRSGKTVWADIDLTV